MAMTMNMILRGAIIVAACTTTSASSAGRSPRLRPRTTATRARPLARAAMSTIPPPPTLVALGDALEQYDALLLDQFGVLHDGKRAYGGATEAMVELQKRRRKRVVVLSNSSKRRLETVNRLHALGLGMCTWLDRASVADGVPMITVVTSGDLVWNGVREHLRDPGAPAPDALFDVPGPRCLVYGNGDDDDEYTATMGCEPAPVEEADFVLARGLFEVRTRSGETGVEAYDAATHAGPLLDAAAARGLPMIVANPDLVRPDGKDSPMPGVLGAAYEARGGSVRYVGKPHARVYEEATRCLMEDGIARERIVAVGDSMEHDIRGARRAGIDAVLVTGGVHAAELHVPQGEAFEPDAARLEEFLRGYPHDEWPTHVCAGFRFDA